MQQPTLTIKQDDLLPLLHVLPLGAADALAGLLLLLPPCSAALLLRAALGRPCSAAHALQHGQQLILQHRLLLLGGLLAPAHNGTSTSKGAQRHTLCVFVLLRMHARNTLWRSCCWC